MQELLNYNDQSQQSLVRNYKTTLDFNHGRKARGRSDWNKCNYLTNRSFHEVLLYKQRYKFLIGTCVNSFCACNKHIRILFAPKKRDCKWKTY